MPTPPEKADRTGVAALVALVAGLVLIVWLALPKDGAPQAPDDAGATSSALASAVDGGATRGHGDDDARHLERLPEAACELAVLVDKPEIEVAKLASAEAIAGRLDVRHCGGTCDALKKLMGDHDHFEVEMMKSDDYILPPKDTYETIAPSLTASERATIGERATTVVIRTRGPSTLDQLPARAAFAATAVVAEAFSGLVYDETLRRIQTSAQFAEHVITVPLGKNVFVPRHIVVQVYRQDDGTARLLTLGMGRFGSPDFTMRGAPMELGPALANIMNVAASLAAEGKTALPIAVTAADVARVSAQAPREPRELTAKADGAKTVLLDAIDTEHTEGDPDNELLELVLTKTSPSNPAAWTHAAASLFGETPRVVFAPGGRELDAIAAHAQRELPAAVKRYDAGEGALFVKGPFAIPESARLDGGAAEEWMWIEVSSCDARGCAGSLSNTPGYATNLAFGKPVRIPRAKIADWVLRLRDGGTAGGDSIHLLQGRGDGVRGP